MSFKEQIFSEGQRAGYFTLALLGFIAAFLLLPTAKMVNNYYYLTLALPAIAFLGLALWKKETGVLRLSTPESLLCGVFLLCCLIQGAPDGGGQYIRHVLYVALFLLAASRLINPTLFRSELFARGLFWVVLAYVFISLAVSWASGQYTPGMRILWLISRMNGCIYTSMWLASCFALALPYWLRGKRTMEMGLALLLTGGVMVFVLQSRSGIVALLAFLALAIIASTRLFSRRHALILLMTVLLNGVILFFVWQQTTIPQELVHRADSYRFELWSKLLIDWQNCGIWQGCGPEFKSLRLLTSGGGILHAHSIYLALGVHNGLPALLLFLALCFFTLKTAWKNSDPWGAYLLTSFIGLAFDGGQIINNPDERWLQIFLPLALISHSLKPTPTNLHDRI